MQRGQIDTLQVVGGGAATEMPVSKDHLEMLLVSWKALIRPCRSESFVTQEN